MALEAVVYPQDQVQYPFNYSYKEESYSPSWGYDEYNPRDHDRFLPGNISILQAGDNHNYTSRGQNPPHHHHNHHQQPNWESYYSSSSPNNSVMQQQARGAHHHQQQYWDPSISSSSPDEAASGLDGMLIPGTDHRVMDLEEEEEEGEPVISGGRRKRRRTKSAKNKEEIESQRMTHIAVERNRRKQMNEYLAVLRSLMPSSYVQRGDQASIIGGAINFVKELEQLMQNMEAHKKSEHHKKENMMSPDVAGTNNTPFAEFFTFPQYSTRATQAAMAGEEPMAAEHRWAAVADIEVTMVESHANLKILSRKRPRQLLKMVAGLQSLRLSVLHLNVTTVDQMVLHSISVKVEEGCHLNTVDEIAAAVNQMIHRIEEEAAFS